MSIEKSGLELVKSGLELVKPGLELVSDTQAGAGPAGMDQGDF